MTIFNFIRLTNRAESALAIDSYQFQSLAYVCLAYLLDLERNVYNRSQKC